MERNSFFKDFDFEATLASIVGLIALAGIIILSVIVFSPKTGTFDVYGVSWRYDTVIEEYKTVRESGWEMPKGATLAYVQNETHHLQPVTTGKTTTLIPVVRPKYYYDIDKWIYVRTNTTSGTNTSPYAPDETCGANERIGKRTHKYAMTGALTYKGLFGNITKDLVIDIDKNDFKEISKGDVLTVFLDGFNNLKSWKVKEDE